MLRSLEALLDVGRGYLGGAIRNAAHRRGIRIFRYHGVVERRADPLLERNQHLLESFRRQMDYLRHFHVLGLDDLLDALVRPNRMTRSAAMVTFDDGFANNLAVVEVMARRRLPWMLFVSVGQIGEGRAMWLDNLSLLILAGNAPRIDAFGAVWPLSTREERERAFRELRPRIKSLPAPAKAEILSAIRAQFPAEESKRLVALYPSLRMMTWRELEEIGTDGLEIGSHGVDHDMHHSEQPAAQRLRELCESRRELESRLRRPCRAFAFPNGDFVPESAAEVETSGYAAGFTTESTEIEATSSRYLLPRLAAPQSLNRFVRVHCFQGSTGPRGKV